MLARRLLLKIKNPLFNHHNLDKISLNSIEAVPFLVRVSFSKSSSEEKKRWLIQIDLGRGAGYAVGLTAFLSRNGLSRIPTRQSVRQELFWNAGIAKDYFEIPCVDED